MSLPLRLAYVCSPAELSQAQSLVVRKQLGGGSKWRTYLVFCLLLAVMLLGAWIRFREIPEGKRALLLAVIVGGSVLFVVVKKKLGKTARRTTHVEISEADFTIVDGDSKIVLPWSAFGECLESPDLFALMDRPKRTLIVVPKRAFPSEDWQIWFRDYAAHALSLPASLAPSQPPTSSSSAAAGRVTLTVRPRYLDCLACTLTSWRTWGMCLFVGAIMLGTLAYAAFNPPPNAVNSTAKVFVLLIPSFAVVVAMAVSIFSIGSWRHARHTGPQEIALSDRSVAVSAADGSATLPWPAFEYFKETPWTFIIWRGSSCVILPKHSFASWNDMLWCRELLERRLKRSRWFVG